MSVDLAIILIAVSTILGGVFVYRWFHPILHLVVSPRFIPGHEGVLVIKLEVTNKSKVRIRIKEALLQILEHKLPSVGELSEWVPFSAQLVKAGEQPCYWQEPRTMLETSIKIDPGETKMVERLFQAREGDLLHIGFQVKAELGLLSRLGVFLKETSDQWTTTTIVGIDRNPLRQA